MLGFEAVVELLADARADLLGNLRGVDHGVHAPVNGEDELQLPQVRLDCRLHVRVLQLAGKLAAVVRACAVYLSKRCGGCGMMLEARKFAAPVGTELGRHAALHECPAHGRRIALELHQLGGVFRRERVGDGGQQLCHLHDRTLETAQRGGKLERVLAAIELKPGYETLWCYIPHFVHSPFYVYAYAFGDCLVNSLYAVYERANEGFAQRYLDMLAAGGTKHHSELLAPFGLDARDPAFWQEGLGVIERMIGELEALE